MRLKPRVFPYIVLGTIGALLPAACGDIDADAPDDVTQKTSAALSARPMGMIIPAYYGDGSADWNRLFQARMSHSLSVEMMTIVSGMNSGPPANSSESPNLGAHIQTLNNLSAFPLGYVNLGMHGHDGAVFADNQITQWKSLYPGLKGIYFDAAKRTDTGDLASFIYLASRVAYEFRYPMCVSTPSGCVTVYYPGVLAVGWGTSEQSPTQLYFECMMRAMGNYWALKWLSLEQSVYDGNPNFGDSSYDTKFGVGGEWSWVRSYTAAHFFQLGHTFYPPTSYGMVGTLAQKIRQRSAFGMYFTTCPFSGVMDPNIPHCIGEEWGQAPSTNFLRAVFDTAGTTYNDYSGGAQDNFVYSANDCPAATL